MNHFTLSLAAGAIAGAVAVLPMVARKASVRNCCAAFLAYLFAGLIVFYSDLPYLPWWADGMGVALMLTIPLGNDRFGQGEPAGSDAAQRRAAGLPPQRRGALPGIAGRGDADKHKERAEVRSLCFHAVLRHPKYFFLCFHAVLRHPKRFFHENLTLKKPGTMKRLLLFLLLPFTLGSCDNDNGSRTEIWTIAPEKGVAGITMYFGYVPAYIVRKDGNAAWETTAARIEGFTFERGVQTTPARKDRPDRQPACRCTGQALYDGGAAFAHSRRDAGRPADVQPRMRGARRLRASRRRGLLPTGSGTCATERMRRGRFSPWEIEGFGFTSGHEYRLRIQPVAVFDESATADDEECLAGQIPVEGDAFGRREGVRRALRDRFSERGGAEAKTGRNRVGKTSLRRPCQSQTVPDGSRQPQTAGISPAAPTCAGLRTKGCAT